MRKVWMDDLFSSAPLDSVPEQIKCTIGVLKVEVKPTIPWQVICRREVMQPWKHLSVHIHTPHCPHTAMASTPQYVSILPDCTFVSFYWKLQSVWAKSVIFELAFSLVEWGAKGGGEKTACVCACTCMFTLTARVHVCMHVQTTCVYYVWSKSTKDWSYMQRTSWETMAGAPELRKGECRISHVLLMCHFTQFQAWLPQ